MLRCGLITVGDTGRQTGGYLYHREVAARLAARGVVLEQVVAAGAQLQAQLAAAPGFAERFDPTAFDLLLVDALARAVCGPTLDAWGLVRPLVAMVHELPSVAGGLDAPAQTAERTREAPLLRAQRLIAVSDDGARLLRARGVAPERIVVAPGGCDRFAFARPLARSPADALSRLPLRVLCVAQWIPRKGVLELAQAWSAVAPLGWVLELVGETDADSAYAQAVRAALAKAPPASVVLHGVLSDEALAAAYGRAALFAMPSRYEGYGIAFAEALACGLPVLGCAVGPVPALVGPEAGLLVPPDDTMALAAALARLLDDAGLRERMARAARARGAQLPSWEQCADGVLRALLEAAGR
jgi:glycosyltransferase involved in cell wall biosynthesis